MSLHLSSQDVVELARAVELLVSPMDHGGMDDWRREVNRHLSGMLGADSAGFMLPISEGPVVYSEEHDPLELSRFPGLAPPPLPDGTPLWSRFLELGATSIAEAYNGDTRPYERSAYYNDYAAPNRAHDPAGMAFSIGGRGPAGVATLQFWHSSRRGKRFSPREISLLRILLPAFRAGVETHLRFTADQARILDVLTHCGQAILLCDSRGRDLQRTPALDTLLAADPEAHVIVAAIDGVVRSARAVLTAPRPTSDVSSLRGVNDEVATSLARYRIAGTVQRLGSQPLIAVLVDRVTPVPLSAAQMRIEFRLTGAEARVAGLLARGLSNAQIARTLGVSAHTARHHTERVLQKLGVTSRAQVSSKVLR